MMQEEDKVYDMLGTFEGRAADEAKRLMVMAGKLWVAGGYFFEKEWHNYLHNELTGTIVNADGVVVGRATSAWAAREVLTSLGENDFEDYDFVRHPHITPEEWERLRQFSQALRQALKANDLRIASSFCLIGESTGGQYANEEAAAAMTTIIGSLTPPSSH